MQHTIREEGLADLRAVQEVLESIIEDNNHIEQFQILPISVPVKAVKGVLKEELTYSVIVLVDNAYSEGVWEAWEEDFYGEGIS